MAEYEGIDPKYLSTQALEDMLDLIHRAKERLGEDYTRHIPEIEAELKRRADQPQE